MIEEKLNHSGGTRADMHVCDLLRSRNDLSTAARPIVLCHSPLSLRTINLTGPLETVSGSKEGDLLHGERTEPVIFTPGSFQLVSRSLQKPQTTGVSTSYSRSSSSFSCGSTIHKRQPTSPFRVVNELDKFRSSLTNSLETYHLRS